MSNALRTRINVPEFRAFDVHIRLPECKWVDICLVVQICQAVVHESVGAFVAPDSVDDIQQLCIVIQTPIVLGDFWSRHVLPRGQMACLKVLNTPSATYMINTNWG